MKYHEAVEVDGGHAHGVIVARTEATLPDGEKVPIVGIKLHKDRRVKGYESGGEIQFCRADRTDMMALSASVLVDDPGGAETVEDAACALVDWLRSEDGPVTVDVQTKRGAGPTYRVVVMIENGRAVGTLDNG